MTNIYVLDLRDISSEQRNTLHRSLSPQRQQRVHACRQQADGDRIAGAGWLLQTVLEQAGIPAAEQRFCQNRWGKPALEGREDLHFSLSHSRNWVVCALSDTPVGVDVEAARCSLAVAQRHFHPDELQYTDDPVGLCRLWTAKEAFVKALGVGLTVPLDSFCVRLTADGAVLSQTQSSLPYGLHLYDLGPCQLCLCTVDDRPELQYVTIP